MSKNVSLQRATQAMNDIIESTALLNKHKANCEEEVTAAKQRYQSGIDDAKAVISEAEETLLKYTSQNRENLLTDGAKSVDFAGGKMGFRLGTPKLELVEGKSWNDVLAAAKKKCPEFVSTKESVDKAAMKKADEKTLKKLGVAVERYETFFVKL